MNQSTHENFSRDEAASPGSDRTFGLVMASVVCFLSVLMAWYGVNFVIGVGLHTYGFGSGGGQASVGIVTLCVLSIAAGCGAN